MNCNNNCENCNGKLELKLKLRYHGFVVIQKPHDANEILNAAALRTWCCGIPCQSPIQLSISVNESCAA